MLTVLRAITQYGGLLWPSSNHTPKQPIGQIRRDFKVVYVAPMKALAAEIVRKMGKRLGWLGFVVKELTGQCLFDCFFNVFHLFSRKGNVAMISNKVYPVHLFRTMI